MLPHSSQGGSEVGPGADDHKVASRAHRSDPQSPCSREKHPAGGERYGCPTCYCGTCTPQPTSAVSLLSAEKLGTAVLNVSQGDRGDRWRLGVRGTWSWKEPYYYCASSSLGGEDTEVPEQHFFVWCYTYMKNEKQRQWMTHWRQ